jgi:hypothetical protein
MGGSVGVESQIGVGSVFWIELNLTKAPLRAVQEADPDVGYSEAGEGCGASHRTLRGGQFGQPGADGRTHSAQS